MQTPAPLVLLMGPEHRFALANPSYIQFVGGRQVLGKNVLEAFTWEEVGSFVKLLDEVYRSGKSHFGQEMRLVIPDENGVVTERFVNTGFHPFRGQDGTIQGVLGIAQDVTEQVTSRRTAEKLAAELQKSHAAIQNERENFRNLFRQTPEMVCILRGPDHVFEFVNEAHIRALGFDATGRAVREAQPESVEVHGILDEVYRTGKTAALNEIPVTVTDRVRYFNLTYAARRDENGAINGIMILGVEITDQVHSRQALAEAKREAEAAAAQLRRETERARFLAEAGTLLASSLDYHDTLHKLARLVVPFLGDWCTVTIINEDRTKHRVAAIHRDPSKNALIEEMASYYPASVDEKAGVGLVITTGKSIFTRRVEDFQLSGAAMDGRHLDIMRELACHSCMVVPIVAHTKILGAISIVSGDPERLYDSSDLAAAEELGRRAGAAIDNARLYDAAQQAVRARDDFMSIASHELKTPLTSLKLQTQLRERDLKKGSLQRFSAENLAKLVRDDLKQLNRLNRLVDEMLDVSRIQTGRLELARDEFDLCEMIQETLSRFSAQIESEGCTVSFKPEGPVTGSWDRFRIEQVFTNLLSNAIKYGSRKPIQVQVSSLADRVSIAVTDHGIGVAEADQERIFGQFERAVSANSISGLGLGLFISKKIVEAHGGSIRVKSEPGQGSTFTVELPLEVLQPSSHNLRTQSGESAADLSIPSISQ